MASACHSSFQLKVLQFNIWQETTMVEGGFEGLLDNLVSLDPDLVTFSEVRNYKGVPFIPKLLAALEERGAHYYGNESVSTGIISKYPILSQELVWPLEDDHGSVIKAEVDADGHRVVLYSAHLDWLYCASYLPRGYDGCSWKQLESPVTDADSLLAYNRLSFRDEEAQAIAQDAAKEHSLGKIVIVGGDFNDPSHLDWREDTKDIRGHNGVVADWDCSVTLLGAGFKDSFRVVYPDPVKNPGFTFPTYNPDCELKKLIWAPQEDDRERIDFLYFLPNPGLSVISSQVVGPQKAIICGRVEDRDPDGEDVYIPSVGVWPTDHRALLTTFGIDGK